MFLCINAAINTSQRQCLVHKLHMISGPGDHWFIENVAFVDVLCDSDSDIICSEEDAM